MIIDLMGGHEGYDEQVYDYCIAGGGVAGIVLARALSRSGRVLLLEGGGLHHDYESQSLYDGVIAGHEYFPLQAARVRYLGGTSNHWSGMMALPLGDIDFERKPNLPWSGWPITRSDLQPYLGEACEILGIQPWDSIQPVMKGSNGNVRKTFFHYRPAPPHMEKFQAQFLGELKSNNNIHVLLNANLVDLKLNSNLSSVRSFIVRSHDVSRKPLEFRAGQYVLALGGIENARALLNADSQIKEGIGNQRDLVGRFFMEHPTFEVGQYMLTKPGRDAVLPPRWRFSQYYSPTAKFMLAHQVGNIGMSFYNITFFNDSIIDTLKNIVRKEACASDGLKSVLEQLGKTVRCPPFSSQPAPDTGLVDASWEQVPNYDSRVRLSHDVDKFILRKVVLDWHLHEIDRKTAREFALEMGRFLARTGYGRMKISDWLMHDNTHWPGLDEGAEVGGYHHMGTTRMAPSSSEGVVNSECRVFGVSNLYLAGSSVFSTSGHANPTLTIIQLALRLADHMAQS